MSDKKKSSLFLIHFNSLNLSAVETLRLMGYIARIVFPGNLNSASHPVNCLRICTNSIVRVLRS